MMRLGPDEAWCEHCDEESDVKRFRVWGQVVSGSKIEGSSFGEEVCVEFVLCDSCVKLFMGGGPDEEDQTIKHFRDHGVQVWQHFGPIPGKETLH